MRKFLSILICIICLSFTSVSARANVTNQLDEIQAQLENLDQVIQWFIDNEENLEWWIGGGIWDDNISPSFTQLYVTVNALLAQVRSGLVPDVDAIREDVSNLVATVGYFYYDFIEMTYTLTQSVLTFRDDFLYFVASELPNILDSNNLLLFQQFSEHFVLELGYLNEIRNAILSLENVWSSDDIIVTIKDLDDIMVNFGIQLSGPLEAALVDLQSHIADASSTLYHFLMEFQLFLSDFNYFLNNWNTIAASELDFIAYQTEFIDWYKGYFFDGLNAWRIKHYEWMDTQLERHDAEDEHWGKLESVFEDDTSFPTDSYIPLDVQLNEVDLDVPDVPDYEIKQAADKVGSDMEVVTYALEDAMDEVDATVTSFLGDVKLEWGKFNSVLSFSFTPPLAGSDYTMVFSYDFADFEWMPICRSVSTGMWGIVLFISSFLAISKTLHAVIEN